MEKSADAFRTISEVADDLTLPQHVLRFWETRFPQIRPLKRAGGRRYYRPADVVLLKTIRQLLYDDGYTIKGVQRLLKEQGPRALNAAGAVALYDPDSADAALAATEPLLEPPAESADGADVEREDESPGFQVSIPPRGRDPRLLEPSPPPAGPDNLNLEHREAVAEALATIEDCLRILAAAARRPS